MLAILTVLLLVAIAYGQIPCDEPYGEFCPDKAGLDVGTCLKALPKGKLSESCLSYIKIHDSCSDDIKKYCEGKEFTGDLLVCLTEWTKPDLISAECKAALPKKEEQKERVLSAAEKKKAEARRRVRDKAKKHAKKDL